MPKQILPHHCILPNQMLSDIFCEEYQYFLIWTWKQVNFSSMKLLSTPNLSTWLDQALKFYNPWKQVIPHYDHGQLTLVYAKATMFLGFF